MNSAVLVLVLAAASIGLLEGAQAWQAADAVYDAKDSAEAGGPVVSLDSMAGATDLLIDGTNEGTATSPTVRSGQVKVSLPFPFEFYGTKYTDVYVNNNGYVSFEAGTASEAIQASAVQAGTSSSGPNLFIAGCWQDHKASDADEGRVSHKTTGTAPDRVFIVGFDDVSQDRVGPGTQPVSTFQIKLFEWNDTVEVHAPADPGCMQNTNSGNSLPGFPTGDFRTSSGIEDGSGAGISYMYDARALWDEAIRYEVRNSPPTAVNDTLTVSEDASATTIDVLATDSDVDGHAFWLADHDTASIKGGTVALDDGGTPSDKTDDRLEYEPAGDYCGADSFNYTIHDERHKSWLPSEDNATVHVTVSCVNDAPVFTAGADVDVTEDDPAYSAAWATGIGPGGGTDEATQTVTFVIDSVSDASLFASGPSITSDGKLEFTPAENATGSADVVLHAKDDGGTPGVDKSASHTLTIDIDAVNDVPVFTPGGPVSVDEDSAPYSVAWATGVGPGGGADEATQTVSFVIESVSDASLFASGPSITSAGKLEFTPAENATGSADVVLHAKDNGGTPGVDKSASHTLTIDIEYVNDAPDVVPGPDIPAKEDPEGTVWIEGWLGATTPGGGPDEVGQTVDVHVIAGPGFADGPDLHANGTLSFTLEQHAAGTLTFQVYARDDNKTLRGGDDTGPKHPVHVHVEAVNDPPLFTPGPNLTHLEDHVIDVPWATAIEPGGGADEASQALAFDVVAVDEEVGAPVIDGSGRLTYTPPVDFVGIVRFNVSLVDDGGGANRSAVHQAAIEIMPVNDAPTIAAGPDLSLEANTTSLHAGWATMIGPGGGADEAAQQLSVGWNGSDAFSGISLDLATGDLVVEAGLPGTYTLELTLMDDNGTANNGTDRSVRSFNITVVAPDAPEEAAPVTAPVTSGPHGGVEVRYPDEAGSEPFRVDAGPDLHVTSAAAFELKGMASEGADVLLAWYQVSGPTVMPHAMPGERVALQAPQGPARLVFELRGTSGTAVAKDLVAVNVQAPAEPAETIEPDQPIESEEPFNVRVEVEGRTVKLRASQETTWDLGDGTTVTGRAVEHTYDEDGTYRIRAHEAVHTVSVASPADVPEPAGRQETASMPHSQGQPASLPWQGLSLIALEVLVAVALVGVLLSRRR